MKKVKMNLAELKVQSFVTGEIAKEEVMGGAITDGSTCKTIAGPKGCPLPMSYSGCLIDSTPVFCLHTDNPNVGIC